MKVTVTGAGEMGGAIAAKAALRHTVTVRGSQIGSASATADEAPTAFVASDDPELKRSVRNFSESLGLASIDAGPLYAAKFTEAMGFLWTALAFVLPR